MSIDMEKLSHAIFLATGEHPSETEVESLGAVLSVSEEVMPHLLLRRDGFRTSVRMREALKAAVARAPGLPATPRAHDLADPLAERFARAAVRDATKALIERDIAGQEANTRLDEALSELVARSPETPWDPSLKIGA